MEKAIFITSINQLKYFDKKYTRLYYGQEFCERLIPTVRDLTRVVSFVQERGLNFTLVTPYVTDFGMNKIKPLLNRLKFRKIKCEIVINDWGVLNLVNREYPDLLPVLGRLLTKQKRSPNLIKLLKRKIQPRLVLDARNPKIKCVVLQKNFSSNLDFYYKGSNTSSVPLIHDFLIARNIQRIELDNAGQGLFLDLPRSRISASVYMPYVYITTTFFCPTAGCDDKKESFLKLKSCDRQCQRYVFKLRHRSMHKVIYLKGNSQFYKNTRSQLKSWKNSGVDRIVIEPEIPV